MTSKASAPTPVVIIDSSDDETEQSYGNWSSTKTTTGIQISEEYHQRQQQPPQSQGSAATATTTPLSLTNKTLICRSFWKAGNFYVGPPAANNFTSAPDLLERARVHPRFLHSNATSHKWAFGAIAELLDNAVDEIENGATFVRVDKVDIMKDNSPALLFQDDGGGMSPEGIRKCMSLGYSSKKSSTMIGQYGNGFKTSTMRLGADVIVFSRAIHAGKVTQSVGLLSYTFLQKTGLDDIIVPMIDFDISGYSAEPIIHGSKDDWSRNLKTILEWSPFSSRGNLMHQFEDIGSHGTKIIIYNLWLNDEGVYELSFDDDNEDIRLRDENNHGNENKKTHCKVLKLQSHISYRIRYSLRAYASVLYLRRFTNFNILLRGKPVEQFNIMDELKYSKVVTYKPQVAAETKEDVVTTIGFVREAPSMAFCGYNVYHKNRLIKPFWKVSADNQSSHGVVGVLEANFIEPAHDKQDFERSSLYIRLEAKLKQILYEYWKGHCHLVEDMPPPSSAPKIHTVHSDHESSTLGTTLQKQIGESGHPSSVYESMPLDPPLVSLAASVQVPAISPLDGFEMMSVDQICEENVQLIARCEQHKKRETQLKNMIQKVEKELGETRKRCNQLSLYIEQHKRLRQQMERL